MFSGKISLFSISAQQLPWSNENKTDQKSPLRPYLSISVDATQKQTVGYQDSAEVNTEHVIHLHVSHRTREEYYPTFPYVTWN